MLQHFTIPKIDTTRLVFGEATKTKIILAKHVRYIISDPILYGKLYIDTINGRELLEPNVYICSGSIFGDIWQHQYQDFENNYERESFTNDGWAYYSPIYMNRINFIQVTPHIVHTAINDLEDMDGPHTSERFAIYALTGKEVRPDPFKPQLIKYEQLGSINDYICQTEDNPDNIWIEKRVLFESIYDKISPAI